MRIPVLERVFVALQTECSAAQLEQGAVGGVMRIVTGRTVPAGHRAVDVFQGRLAVVALVAELLTLLHQRYAPLLAGMAFSRRRPVTGCTFTGGHGGMHVLALLDAVMTTAARCVFPPAGGGQQNGNQQENGTGGAEYEI
jgi:hypothetical protein